MNAVENAAYKLPDGYHTLANSYRFRDNVIRSEDLHDLPRIAGALGFQATDKLPTKRSTWQVFDRPEHDVPNFPEGSTRISSMLAVYTTERGLTHAILRTSPEPFPSDEFQKDLATFTKHYVERPVVLGFPSQALTGLGGLYIAIGAGAILLGGADHYTINSIPGGVVNLGTFAGSIIGGPTVYGALRVLSERYARKSIPHPEQYSAGLTVASLLTKELNHRVAVVIQEELYLALQQEGASLTPDQFLETRYGELPQVLVGKRRKEVKQAMYPRLEPSEETGNFLPALIEACHILEKIEFHENLADDLRNTLEK